MPGFADGAIRFQNVIFPQKKDLFQELSDGQSPEALFITCSDSRIETAMITQTDPGDLFICRNAGNIVPPYNKYNGGTTATIEFAVSALKVPHIVICGHTQCGAMRGALHPESVSNLPHVREWIGFTKPALDYVMGMGSGKSENERMQMLIERNVVLQLENLKGHASVVCALAAGALCLHGWVYDIATGAITVYDENNGKFTPIDSFYAPKA